ncbi:MAG: UBP-type zinc finger domain-containing protein [Chloroflexota bacterium]
MNDAAIIQDAVRRVKAGELKRPTNCVHVDQIQEVEPAAFGCVDCMATGSTWVHLRVCLTCGYTGCCNSSPNKHAQKHADETGHHVVMSMEGGEEWMWCYEDDDFIVPRRR